MSTQNKTVLAGIEVNDIAVEVMNVDDMTETLNDSLPTPISFNNNSLSFEIITPSLAKEYISNMVVQQRPLRKNYVKKLATDMVEGRYKFIGDCITLINGKLGNGQHRLNAVVEADKPQIFAVLRTTDENMYKAIDCGKTRTVSDVFNHVEYATQSTAVINTILSYQKNCIGLYGGSSKTTRGQVIDFFELNQNEINAVVKTVSSFYREAIQKPMTVKIGSVFLFLAQKNTDDNGDALNLIRFLFEGHDGFTKDATFKATFESQVQAYPYINQLKDRLNSFRSDKTPTHQHIYLASLIKVYNSFKKGETTCVTKIYRSKKATFPKFYFEPETE